MMVAKKVYAFQCPDDQCKDLAWTYKVYQERSLFTDVHLVCERGAKINAHGAVLLRHCPQLRLIAAKFACCYCHGTDCGGCDKNGNLMTVYLPDFSKETVMSFLELIYTGRTFFMSNEAYERVVDLGKHLGFAVPASGLSLVHGEEEESRPLASTAKKVGRKKRSSAAFVSSEPESSTPLRKRSRIMEPDPDVSEVTLDTSKLMSCQSCELTFASKYLLKKHSKNCLQLSTALESEEVSAITEPVEAAPVAEEAIAQKKKCQNCGEFFPIQGGWVKKHARKCTGKKADAPNETRAAEITVDPAFNDSSMEDLEAEVPRVEVIFNTTHPERRNSVTLKKECPRCGKSFATNGGWLTKHLARCQGTLSIENISGLAEDDKQAPSNEEVPSCPKCGKTYAPHVRRFLKDHINVCNGDASQKDESTEAVPETPRATDAETAPDNLHEFEAMYKRGEWNCYMCDKWFGRRDVLRQHLLVHYRHEIRADFMDPADDSDNQTVCSICHFKAKDHKSLVQHISLIVHQKLRDYLPASVKNLLFPKPLKKPPKKEDSSELETKPTKEISAWVCCVCQARFKERPQLTDHIVDHFTAKILDRYVESGTKCKICKYHDANLHQMTRHVALQHEKIREYIPAKEGDSLFKMVPPSPKKEVLEPAEAPLLPQSPAKPKFQCFICDKPNKSRSDMRQHLFCHYKGDIQAKYYPDNEPVKLCKECPYKSSVPEHVLMHLALKHQKITEFVPKDIAPSLYKDRVAAGNKAQNSKSETTTNAAPKGQPKPVNCVRCKATIPGKEELRKHLESCNWKCDECGLELRDPKGIKQHRFKCQSNPVVDAPPSGSPGRPSSSPSEALTCRICQRECKHFHYLKGHMSMHFREELRKKVSDWGGGLGGSGYACRSCDFVTSTRDSLVTHAGYKHALFVGFMDPELRTEFYEFAAQAGEKTELWDDSSISKFPCPKCKVDFESQLSLASHMTNMNCQPMITVRCLLCDIAVGSALQYKCHLLVHYITNLENEVAASFKENGGVCKECGEEGRSLDFQEFVRHIALDHDRLTSIVSPEVRTHMNISFPDSMPLTRSDDKENSKTETFHEEIHIEIEPVDDGIKDDEEMPPARAEDAKEATPEPEQRPPSKMENPEIISQNDKKDTPHDVDTVVN